MMRRAVDRWNVITDRPTTSGRIVGDEPFDRLRTVDCASTRSAIATR